MLGEENSEDTSKLDTTSRDFLDSAIRDYNEMFHTNYSTDGEKFQNYYKDVSLRMKNRELDLLIVVNMFLTGFDATTLNTLWVDKNLKMHGLIQTFSRTNRILNSVKTFGNIVCFRNLQKRVDEAVALFGDKNAGGVVLLRKFEDYYYGYDKNHPGYKTLVKELKERFPLDEPIADKKEFVTLFSNVLRMRNLLTSFDEFRDDLSERELQDYSGRYQDVRDEMKPDRDVDKKDISDDIVFEMELIRQVEINIDYILMLVKKYHDSNDKEVLVSIRKAVNSSSQLRSKKELIENFISQANGMDDVMEGWSGYVAKEREKELSTIIEEEKLKDHETRKFMENSFREGEVKTTGTNLDQILPPLSRFGGKRAKKKQEVTDRLKDFYDRYYGIGGPEFTAEQPMEEQSKEKQLSEE